MSHGGRRPAGTALRPGVSARGGRHGSQLRGLAPEQVSSGKTQAVRRIGPGTGEAARDRSAPRRSERRARPGRAGCTWARQGEATPILGRCDRSAARRHPAPVGGMAPATVEDGVGFLGTMKTEPAAGPAVPGSPSSLRRGAQRATCPRPSTAEGDEARGLRRPRLCLGLPPATNTTETRVPEVPLFLKKKEAHFTQKNTICFQV